MDESASAKSPPAVSKIFDNFFTKERKKKIDEIVSELDYIPNVPLLGLKAAKFKVDDLQCKEADEIIKNVLLTMNGHYWEGKVTLMSVLAATIQSAGPSMAGHMSPELKEHLVDFLKQQSTQSDIAYEGAVINCLTKVAVNWKDEVLANWIAENAKRKIELIINSEKDTELPSQLLNCEREKQICDGIETHLTAIVKCIAVYSSDLRTGPIFDTFAALVTNTTIPWRGRATIFEPLEETLKTWNPDTPVSINLLSRSIVEFSKELKDLKQHNASYYIGSTIRWFASRPTAFKKNTHFAELMEDVELEKFQKKLLDVNINDVNQYEASAEVDKQCLSTTKNEKEPQTSAEQSGLLQTNIFDAFPVKEKFEVLQKYISTTNPGYGTALQKILMDGDCENEKFQEFVKQIRNDNLKKDEFKKLVENYVKQKKM